MNKKSLYVSLVVIIGVIAIIGAYQFPSVKESVRDVVNLGAITGPQIYDALELEGGVKYGNNTATTTRVSGTLKLAEIMNSDILIVTPTGAASAKTLTLFATSSAAQWLPLAGDTQRTCIYNATTTAGATIVFAEGTGFDIEVATSTAHLPNALSRTIAANNFACFTFIRKPATASTFDIGALFNKFGDGQ